MEDSPIFIRIATDKDGYTAGSILRGTVCLSISSQQSKYIAAKVLQLKLVGKESAVVHRLGGEYDGDDTSHFYRSSHIFFQLDYPLHTFKNQRAPAGQYEYPFQLDLPRNLPSTMKAENGQVSTCEVEYELMATLVPPEETRTFHSDPNGKKTVSVWASMTKPIDSSIQNPPKDTPVTRCCCCQKGSMTLEVCVNNSTVEHNDLVQVQFRCQNNSSLDVRAVEITLEQKIEWRCDGHSEKIERVLGKVKFDGEQFPELDASPPQSIFCCLFGGSRVSSAPLSQEQFCSAHLRVPENAYDTYMGKAVHIWHYLRVELVPNGWFDTGALSSNYIQVVRRFSGPNNTGHRRRPHLDERKTNEADSADDAQTPQVVVIPMEEAILIEPSRPPGEKLSVLLK